MYLLREEYLLIYWPMNVPNSLCDKLKIWALLKVTEKEPRVLS